MTSMNVILAIVDYKKNKNMNYLLILALILTIVIWTIAIYLFGWWGAIGCLVIGIAGTLWIEIKGLP